MSKQCLRPRARSALLIPIFCMGLLSPRMSWAETPGLSPQEEPSEGSNPPQEPDLMLGQVVRVKSTSVSGRLKGPIRSLDDTQITIVGKGGESVSVPWSSVKRLDVQVGLRRRYIWIPVMTGVGAVLVLAKPEHDTKTCVPFGGCRVEEAPSRGSQAAVGAGLGFVVGLIAVGTSDPSVSKWKRVRLPFRPSTATSLGIGIMPGQDGVAVRLVVGF